jgi:hypothetical protein
VSGLICGWPVDQGTLLGRPAGLWRYKHMKRATAVAWACMSFSAATAALAAFLVRPCLQSCQSQIPPAQRRRMPGGRRRPRRPNRGPGRVPQNRHQLLPSASRPWSPPRTGRGEISLPPRRFIITKSQFFKSFSRWACYLAWKVPLNISLLTSVIEKYHYQACRLGWKGSRVLERNRS